MINISISNKQLKPAVVHTNQFEDGVNKLSFTIEDYLQGTTDLRKFKAYAVTSVNGQMDITEIPYTVDGRVMTLTWDVSAWTLKTYGVIQYQIRFSESVEDGTAVWYSYKGILVNRISINADDYVSANYPTLLKQWLDRINQLSGSVEGGAAVVYMPVGQSIDVSERLAGKLYYQIENATTYEGRFEDHTGARLGEFNAKHVADPDLNTMLAHGEYFCVGLLNSELHFPMSCTIAFLHVTDSGSANQQLQTLHCVENNQIRTFVRSVKGTDFGTWQELATTDYVDSATSNIQTQLNDKASSSDLNGHTSNNTIHITANERTAWNGKANSTHSHAISDVTNLQTSLDAKQNKNIGTANMVLVTDANGKIAASSTISTSELSALNGFIIGGGTAQTQIDAAKNKIWFPNYTTTSLSEEVYLSATSTSYSFTASNNCLMLLIFKPTSDFPLKTSSSGKLNFLSLTVKVNNSEVVQLRGTSAASDSLSLPLKTGDAVSFSFLTAGASDVESDKLTAHLQIKCFTLE